MSSANSEEFAICRRIEIDAAHRVPHHESKCYAVHGHRYVIEAWCVGQLFAEGEQQGMVMDFGFLKDCMMETIHDPCDHGIILWNADPLVNIIFAGEAAWGGPRSPWKTRLIDTVPTAENLAQMWYKELQASICRFFAAKGQADKVPELESVTVWETPNCKATYPW